MCLPRQKKIELAEENLAIADDFARKAEIRYNVGEATNLERLTAAVQRTQARNALEVAQNDLKVSLGELYYALGRTKEEQLNKIILTDSLVYQPITETLEQLTERAFAVNPQLKAASGRVSVASMGSHIGMVEFSAQPECFVLSSDSGRQFGFLWCFFWNLCSSLVFI